MDYRDLENLGLHMSQKIRDAIDSFDFERLNQEIRRNADDVIFGRKNSYDNYDNYGTPNDHYGTSSRGKRRRGKSVFGNFQQQNWQTYKNVRPWWAWSKSQGDSEREDAWNEDNGSAGTRKTGRASGLDRGWTPVDYGFPVERSPKGEISGMLLTVFGAIGFGFATCGCMVLGIMAGLGSWLASLTILCALLPADIVFAIMMAVGTMQRKRVKRFRRYLDVIKGKSFATFKNLAQSVGKSEGFVRRDVVRMLELGYFPQGHVDSHKTCLMVTDSIYRQYQETMENARKMEQEQTREKNESGQDPAMAQEIARLEALGRQYMEIIRKANDDIPDTQISNKLYRMEMIIGKIFEYIKSYPQKADRLSRFQDYYMPMTIKLVETYRDIDGQPVEGENIKKVKNEIAATLDTINEAYEKLYDSMYQETAMDVSSDISVLRTLLAQEGLTGSDFYKKDKK